MHKLLFLLSTCVSAQTLSFVGPALPYTVGQPIAFSINLTSGSSPIAALQWDLFLPTGWTSSIPTIGPAATSAGKTISCNALRCIISGLNQNVIASGNIARINIIPSTANDFPIMISSGVSPDGSAVKLPIPHLLPVASGTMTPAELTIVLTDVNLLLKDLLAILARINNP